jgi:hypothetical protein
LATTILRGRVELPKDACSERIAVLATPTSGQQQGSKSEPRPNVDGIDADGGFALDLPPGAYSLQLVDLLSGIVFHTEAQDIAIDGQTAPIALRPAIRWLTVACTPQQPGCEVVLQKFRVSLARPRSGALRAFLNGRGRNRMQEDGDVGFHIGGIEQRWMVPQGEIEIEAVQNFEVLRPHSGGYSETTIATAKVDIDKPEQRVTLKIPPPPSDEELLRRD